MITYGPHQESYGQLVQNQYTQKDKTRESCIHLATNNFIFFRFLTHGKDWWLRLHFLSLLSAMELFKSPYFSYS